MSSAVKIGELPQKQDQEMTKVETIRAFIAVQIPDEVKARFGEIQRDLQASGADVRWVKPGNAHITLQFLGDTRTDLIEPIESALRRVAASHHAFDVSVGGLGVFPNERRPRVVWIGISQGADSLASLQSAVSEETKKLGFKSEKREYSPHITLGRVKTPKNLEALIRLLDANRDFRAGTFRPVQLHLIRSTLSPQGPTYTALFSPSLPPPPS
jgi:2'-5' RNA ligase